MVQWTKNPQQWSPCGVGSRLLSRLIFVLVNLRAHLLEALASKTSQQAVKSRQQKLQASTWSQLSSLA